MQNPALPRDYVGLGDNDVTIPKLVQLSRGARIFADFGRVQETMSDAGEEGSKGYAARTAR